MNSLIAPMAAPPDPAGRLIALLVCGGAHLLSQLRMLPMNEMVKLTAKDFATDQEVRWCPGCGDYAVLKAVQRTMPDLGADPAKTVFVSGIGCSSRFPYYMETYGFHTIHGRAPAVATGVKLANPDLDVWIITGDGDALSIGGNHTMHLLRRNLDCQILLFNNEIYGLTKGQYSPTAAVGTRSPLDALRLGRSAGPALRLRARLRRRASSPAAIDVHKNLPDVLKAAHAHKGAAFVEIFQNCIVYNDDVFAPFTAKENAGKQLWLKAGEPMLFDDGSKGLTLDRQALNLKVVEVVGRRLAGGGRDRPRSDEQGGRAYADRHADRQLPDGAGRDLRRSPSDLRKRGARAERRRPPRASPPISRRSSPRARPGRSSKEPREICVPAAS